MFDLKITEIFSTLGVGIVAGTIGIYLYFLFCKLFVPDKFDRDKFFRWLYGWLEKDYKTSFAVIFTVLIYFVGNIAGNLTDHMTDSDETHKSIVLRELKWASFLPTEGELRKTPLYDSSKTNPVKESRLYASGLGKSIFREKTITDNANRINASSFFKDSLSIASDEAMKDSLKQYVRNRKFSTFINQIYYSAKNWCYTKDNENLKELKSLQNQIDFSRSVVLLVIMACQVIIAFCFAYNLLYFIKWWKMRPRPAAFNWRNKNAHRDAAPVKSALGFYFPGWELLALVLIFFCCRECYMISETNFNKRAYGNYVSYLQELPLEKNATNVVHNISFNCSKDSLAADKR